MWVTKCSSMRIGRVSVKDALGGSAQRRIIFEVIPTNLSTQTNSKGSLPPRPGCLDLLFRVPLVILYSWAQLVAVAPWSCNMMQVGRLLLALHVITVTTVGFSACVTANPTVWTQRRSKDNTIRRQQTYPSLISAAAGTRGQQVAFGFRRSSTSSTEKVVASRTLEEAVKEEPEGLGAVNEPAPSRWA